MLPTVTILSEDVDLQAGGVGFTRIYRTPRNHVVRVAVWKPNVAGSAARFEPPPPAAAAAVLDSATYEWRQLLDIGPASWPEAARGANNTLSTTGAAKTFAPVADDVYQRVLAVLNCLDSPVAASVPVVDTTVTDPNGALVATYSSTERARREVEVINEDANATVLVLAQPVPHDPPTAVLRAATAASRTRHSG